ncbi:MAG: putative DNA modification/repair radical SAM protein [Bacteroidetes bacterium]|nr:putative DNA modification/repair radical SAM protein [Bacteroidota bacterium]
MSFMEKIQAKLAILADAAKYDVSCSSSGSTRKNKDKGLGDTGSGICHTYTEDGRCVSLLKILMSNICIYDCAYCVTRRSNDIRRTSFSVDEVVNLTMNFYRRNYIEGLFLSSGIMKSADYTMERMVLIAKKLRTEQNFNGYIHLKSIPGASADLMHAAGLYADRLSMNIEMPTNEGLKLLAPDKKREDMIVPIRQITNEIVQYQDERKTLKKVPTFVPAGQSTQVIVGATGESDRDIMKVASAFYDKFKMKRVYYSGYVPISNDNRLPALSSQVPLLRENRLYQADWLQRFYGFTTDELLPETIPFFDSEIDPKLGWALRNMSLFPLDINKADKAMLLRVPGIGLNSINKIMEGRKFGQLTWDHLKKMGIATNRAKHFITCAGLSEPAKDLTEMQIKSLILSGSSGKFLPHQKQLSIF